MLDCRTPVQQRQDAIPPKDYAHEEKLDNVCGMSEQNVLLGSKQPEHGNLSKEHEGR
jgi:hypothetical protein